MADDKLQITVSYNGREKRIPLVVQPSIELSDFEVDQAELELCGIVRHIFNIAAEAGFSLHEAETDRTLTKESFRDPTYVTAFPKFWYLTVDKTTCEAGGGEEEEDETAADKVSAVCSSVRYTSTSLLLSVVQYISYGQVACRVCQWCHSVSVVSMGGQCVLVRSCTSSYVVVATSPASLGLASLQTKRRRDEAGMEER